MASNEDQLPPLPAHMEKLSVAEEEALLAVPGDNSKPEEPAQRPRVLAPEAAEVPAEALMDDDLSEGGDSEARESEDNGERQAPLTDEECNRRWRRNRPYTYREEGIGPDSDTRRSLTELIEEAAEEILKNQPKEKDVAWLFGHPDGRALLNPWIRKLYAYCPEIRSWIQIQWVDPRSAYEFYLTSPKKPPFNKTRLSVEEVYSCKGMQLDYPRDNLIYTGQYTGSWPGERLFCDAFTVLEANGNGKERRHERSWKSSSKSAADQPGPSHATTKQKPQQPAEKRPRVHCACGQAMRCPDCD